MTLTLCHSRSRIGNGSKYSQNYLRNISAVSHLIFCITEILKYQNNASSGASIFLFFEIWHVGQRVKYNLFSSFNRARSERKYHSFKIRLDETV